MIESAALHLWGVQCGLTHTFTATLSENCVSRSWIMRAYELWSWFWFHSIINSRLKRPVVASSSQRSVTQEAACSQISWSWWPTPQKQRIGIQQNWLWRRPDFANNIRHSAFVLIKSSVYLWAFKYKKVNPGSLKMFFPTVGTGQGALWALAKRAVASWEHRAFSFRGALFFPFIQSIFKHTDLKQFPLMNLSPPGMGRKRVSTTWCWKRCTMPQQSSWMRPKSTYMRT